MALDITLSLVATVASYRLLAWAFFTPSERFLVFFLKKLFRGFYCDDENIKEQLKENTVPTLILLIITLAGPFFIIVFANFIKMRRQNITLAGLF